MTEKVFLTDRYVRNVKPNKNQRLEIPDAGAPGLRLMIQSTGAKSWVMRFRRPDGRSAKMTLGSADTIGREESADPVIGGHLTLAAARRLAAEMRRQLKLGRDPAADAIATKQKRKWEAIERSADTMSTALRTFVLRETKPKNRTWAQTARFWGFRVDGENLVAVKGGLADRWGSRPVSEITKADIVKLMDGYVDRKKRPNLPFRSMRRFFRWLEARGQIERSPLAGMQAPAKAPARDRVLTNDELRGFWLGCAKLGVPFGPLFRLLLLTGQRRGEVAGMARSELSKSHDLWSLPPARTKNGRAHTVPLSLLARETLEPALRLTAKHDLIFTDTGETPVSGFSKAKRRLDAIMGSSKWRLHDLRRTTATGLQRLGFQVEVTEAVLNHASGEVSGVAAVYARHDYADEKRKALDAWAREVERIAAGEKKAKVVPLVGGPGLHRLRAHKDAEKVREQVLVEQRRARDKIR